MSDLNVQPQTRSDARKKNKRRPIIAFALATLAVGGVGAALTSAAWTDNVFFSASADAATYNLLGSLTNNGTDWVESDSKNPVQLTVPATQFAKLLPGQSRTVSLYVKNDSNVSTTLVATPEWATGSTFVTAPTTAVTGPATLAPGATATFTLTVTAPANWDVANKGKTGTIIVTVNGTATS